MKLPSCSCSSGFRSSIHPGRNRSPCCISHGPSWKWDAWFYAGVNCWRPRISCGSGKSTSDRNARYASPLQLLFKILLHARPFRIQNAEVDRIAKAATPGDQVLPERSFFHCADPADRITRALVEGVSLELDTNATENLKRVTKHQVLGF